MPISTHQAVLLLLFLRFHDYLAPRGGVAMVSALRMRIREGKFRQPDLLLLRDRSDPRDATITVLALDGDSYVEHGAFARGGSATSPLLEGFTVDVAAVFDAPESSA